jgi:hypothetical protein
VAIRLVTGKPPCGQGGFFVSYRWQTLIYRERPGSSVGNAWPAPLAEAHRLRRMKVGLWVAAGSGWRCSGRLGSQFAAAGQGLQVDGDGFGFDHPADC